jgi:hypothetical protein
MKRAAVVAALLVLCLELWPWPPFLRQMALSRAVGITELVPYGSLTPKLGSPVRPRKRP